MKKKLTDVQKMAEMAHTLFCTMNHDDMCGWYYEADTENAWAGFAHKEWVKYVEDFLKRNPKVKKAAMVEMMATLVQAKNLTCDLKNKLMYNK